MHVGREILEILHAFGGGRGGEPGNVAVRFLLPTFFWATLASVAGRQWRRERGGQDLAVAVAALLGMGRELLMFTAEYGSLRGFVDFSSLYRLYPPLEHAVTMLSGVTIAAAFINYRLSWQRFSRRYLAGASAVILALYAATAARWPAYLRVHPRVPFGLFWGDMAFRIAASLLMGLALGVLFYGRHRGRRASTAVLLGFLFLFLDEFLMIFNLLTRERHVGLFAPIRHNLHIWAIPCFLGSYWTDMKHALRTALAESRRMLLAAEEEKEKTNAILAGIGDAVIVTDTNGVVMMINHAAELLMGLSGAGAAGRHISELFRTENRNTREASESLIENILRTGRAAEAEYARHTVLVRKDGAKIDIEDNAAPIRDREGAVVGVVLVFRDMTARHRMEEELAKIEKLQSVGLLAGGIAHDFNNMLTAIIGNISVARLDADRNSRAFLRLEEAEKAARRATDLTYQLLTFSKGGAPIKKASSITGIVQECANFALAGTQAAMRYEVAADLWPVAIDPGQISQVFNNLLINAVHAMPGGGVITCTAENVVLGENDVPALRGGRYAKISIRDTGTGILPEHIHRVFDPYFTTKQGGSGLGLASAFSIIRRHDGHLSVASQSGEGAEFLLYLPATQERSQDDTLQSEVLVKGRGRILVMDDDQAVLDVAVVLLERLGYETVTTRRGEEAVELYEQALREDRRFDAVIMDLTIPGGMGGKDAVARLRVLDPGVIAIASSGYSNDPVMAEYEEHGFCGVMVKPYSIDTIGRVLGRELSGRS